LFVAWFLYYTLVQVKSVYLEVWICEVYNSSVVAGICMVSTGGIWWWSTFTQSQQLI